jgi:hypothetical protein
MTDYRVIIPDESFYLVKFVQDDLAGVGSINMAIRNFDPKSVFPWHPRGGEGSDADHVATLTPRQHF